MEAVDSGKNSGFVLLGAALFGLPAIRIVYMGLTHDPRFTGASWIAYVLATLCAACSIALFTIWAGRKVNGELFAFVFLGCLVTVFGWTAMSGGIRGCFTSLDAFLPRGVGCRVASGFFSILFLPMTILVGRRLLYRGLGAKDPPA